MKKIAALVALATGLAGTGLRAEGPNRQEQAKESAKAISPDQFDKLFTMIRPQAELGETKWTEIPWLTNTLEARRRASAEDKPIIVWTMSACPLGGD
jgi:hypothetical protein